MRPLLVRMLLVLSAGGLVEAHHSFAVFFDDTKIIEIKGTVTEFRFTNPHAEIVMTVDAGGKRETWKAETNAVTLLRRRGWTKDSLKSGEVITVEGWPSRDGAPYMRMRKVTRADGTGLGAPAINQRVD